MRNLIYRIDGDRAETTRLRGPAFNLARDGSVGLREIAGAAFDSLAFSRRSVSRSQNMRKWIEPALRRLAELTGDVTYATLRTPRGKPTLEPQDTVNPRLLRDMELALAAATPQIQALRKQGAKDLKTYEEVKVDIAAEADRLDARAADMARRGGPGATAAAFVGGMPAVMADPINLATLPWAATTAFSVLKTAMFEAGINAVAEGLIQPFIWSYQNELGRDYGSKEVLASMAMATGGGFVLGGSLAGVRRAAQIASLRGKTGDWASAYHLAVEQGRMGSTLELDAAARVFREAADVVDESPMPDVTAHRQAHMMAEEALLNEAPVDVSPVITPLRDRLQGTLQTAFDLADNEAEATLLVADSFAQRWARDRGMEPGDWYEQTIAGVTKGVVPEGAARFQGTKGAVEFLEDGRAVIRALHQPDVSTAMHEFALVFRRSLSDEHLRVASQWAGVKGSKWTAKAEEKFGRGFERYLREGKSPTPALREVFDRFKDWMRGVYRSIKGTPIDVQLNKDIRRVFTEIPADRAPDDYLVELLGTAEGRRSVKAAEQVTDEAERMSAEYVQGQNEDFAAGRIDENAETARVHDEYEQLVEDDPAAAVVADSFDPETGEPAYRSAREALDELDQDEKYMKDLAACVRGVKKG